MDLEVNNMNLWIRSQDKETILKAYNIQLNNEGNMFWLSNNDGKIYTTLGTYKTKERALELLDEIHERIAILTTVDLVGVDDTSLKIFNEYLKEKSCSAVYEMPKE